MKKSKNFPAANRPFPAAFAHADSAAFEAERAASIPRPQAAGRAFAASVLPPDDGGVCDATEIRKSGFSDAEAKRLGRPESDGDTPAADSVDLHEIANCTADKAHRCLDDFLRAKIAAGIAEIKIIHGHGGGRNYADAGVLRRKIRRWLARSEWVLAFAEPRNNRGCTRVRLRRRR